MAKWDDGSDVFTRCFQHKNDSPWYSLCFGPITVSIRLASTSLEGGGFLLWSFAGNALNNCGLQFSCSVVGAGLI